MCFRYTSAANLLSGWSMCRWKASPRFSERHLPSPNSSWVENSPVSPLNTMSKCKPLYLGTLSFDPCGFEVVWLSPFRRNLNPIRKHSISWVESWGLSSLVIMELLWNSPQHSIFASSQLIWKIFELVSPTPFKWLFNHLRSPSSWKLSTDGQTIEWWYKAFHSLLLKLLAYL